MLVLDSDALVYDLALAVDYMYILYTYCMVAELPVQANIYYA